MGAGHDLYIMVAGSLNGIIIFFKHGKLGLFQVLCIYIDDFIISSKFHEILNNFDQVMRHNMLQTHPKSQKYYWG